MRPANRALTSTRYRAAIWLALCVFGLKALVPQGFMPGSDPGTTLIQLCSAAGPIWIADPSLAGHKHQPHQDAQHAEQSAVCAVGAALAALPLLSSPPGLIPAGTVTRRAVARAPPPFATPYPLSAPLGARAPPSYLG